MKNYTKFLYFILLISTVLSLCANLTSCNIKIQKKPATEIETQNKDSEHVFSYYTEGTSPTCTKSGLKGYYFCHKCGLYFDEDRNEIKDLNIDALGHEYGNLITSQDENHAEYGILKYRNCSRCGKKISENNVELTDALYSVYGSEGISYMHNKDGCFVHNIGTCKEKNIWIASKTESEDVTVTSIEANCFINQYFLTRIVVPETITGIGTKAFCNCKMLKEIVIPHSLKNIGSDIFNGCSSLKTIYYSGNNSEWDELNFKDNSLDFRNITICFYSESEPIDNGNYWHFINGIPVKW